MIRRVAEVFQRGFEFFFRKCYIIGILCSHSLGVGNRVSKSDRPFGGKKEEEGSLLKLLPRIQFVLRFLGVEMCAIYMFSFRMGGVRYLLIFGGGEGEGGSIA